MKFTIQSTARLELPKGSKDCVFWDDDISGFGVRLREGGSRNWIYRYRIGSKQRSVILGSAKSVPLALARKNAGELEARVKLGQDPALDRENARLAADNTFGVLANQYLAAKKKGWRDRSYVEFERHLLKYAKPLHRLPITAITQRNIANLLNDIAENSGDVTANRVRATLSSLFSYILEEGVVLPAGNVASYTGKRKEDTRERVLSDAELKAIWSACEDDDFGAAIKLLILTGQREIEIGSLVWDEIHDDEIILPSERTKNHRSHVIPLSEPAKQIIANVLAIDRRHVFGRDDTGFQGWGNAKRRLDSRIAGPLPHWTIHDLRRTVATKMADLGVQPHVIEAIINHASGHKSGVAGIYNRATYAKEKREALNLWGEHVIALVEGRAPSVVPLRRA